MREIKFRTWNKVTKVMYNSAIYNCKDSFDMILKSPQIYEVMQYTGLKDKNGVEIYEGDVLHKQGYWDIYIGFNERSSSFGFIAVDWVVTQGNFQTLSEQNMLTYEIIGNIHENSELLKM